MDQQTDARRPAENEPLVVDTPDKARDLLCKLEGMSCQFGLDLETAGCDPSAESPVGRGTTVCWSLSWPDPALGQSRHKTPLAQRAFLWSDALPIFRQWLANPAVQKVGYNVLAYDKHILCNDGFELQGVSCDGLRLGRLLNAAAEAKHGLKDRLANLFGYKTASFSELFSRRVSLGEVDLGPTKHTKRRIDGRSVPTVSGGVCSRVGAGTCLLDLRRIREEYPSRLPGLYEYASLDAKGTLELYYYQRAAAERTPWRGLGQGATWGNLWDFYQQIWHPFLEVLYALERAGIRYDAATAEPARKAALEESGELLESLRNWAGSGEFNPGSTQQLTELLYGRPGGAADGVRRLGYPVPAITGTLKAVKRNPRGKLPTGEAALTWLVTEGYGSPDLTKLLRWKKVSRLAQFLEKLPQHVSSACRIHSVMQPETATGRLTSKNPNLQQIPTEDEFNIRKAFIAAPGCKLVVADYSSLEPRILAHFLIRLLGDDTLAKAIEAGDIYAWIAGQAWPGQPLAEVRKLAKIIFLARCYGKQTEGLALQLSRSTSETAALESAFDAAVPGILKFQDWAAEHARNHRGISTLLGRFRPIPEVLDTNKYRRAEGERMAFNTPIQGSAADIMSSAMVKLHRALASLPAQIVLNVHDELVVECNSFVTNTVAALVKQHMENPLRPGVLAVPLVVHPVVCNSWAEGKA